MEKILSVSAINKVYKSGARELAVLKDINFSVRAGESVSITGPSGSGKTTLLGLCAGLDEPTSGDIHLCGQKINGLSEDEKAAIRNVKVGFIFQNFQLIPTLTALENVMIPLELLGIKTARKVSADLLDRVGLGDRMKHYPDQLSGGEQQRVSIARAFSNTPQILFADEPTGNLDSDTGDSIEKLLFDLNRQEQTTLVIVTHDMELEKKTDRIIRLRGGRIIEDTESKLVQS